MKIPEGSFSIPDAEYITQAYNAAMQASDAKYKIYLHQDVFLLNKKLIEDILEIFKDETIGMIWAIVI